MKSGNPISYRQCRPGFTLPAVLVIVGALLVLAVGILLVSSIERSTARTLSDRERAKLAARAGMEEVRALLARETANDDYVVLQSALTDPIESEREPAPYLFVARGTSTLEGSDHIHRYVPLFSASSTPENAAFAAPEVEPLVGADPNERIDFQALPYHDKVRVSWMPVRDDKDRIVARYAYWIEDLQSRVDPAIAGNTKGADEDHARVGWPFPAPGLNDEPEAEGEPALDQIALFALDPAATDAAQGELGKTLIENRPLLVSPESQLAAAEIQPPLTRLTAPSPDGGVPGDLVDPVARAVERGLATGIQPYLEQPLIPFAEGITSASAGTPKLNLNELLAKDRATAVDEMAAHISQALPNFEQRKGGFPDDYLKTLAANALDYADEDNEPSIGVGYRGLDANPLMSEIALQINYLGISNQNGRKIMTFRFKLFAELFNPTTKPTSGSARLSYEVDLRMDGIGSGTGDIPFDDPSLLTNPDRSTHDLVVIDGRYWTREVNVSLEPNQYRFYPFADVTYRMDVGPSSIWIPDGTPFSLNEPRGSSGLSLMWNAVEIDRASNIVRQEGLVAGNQPGYGFRVNINKTSTKAALPGHVYDDFWPSMYYNMGDPRITTYLRNAPLAEIAYPENSSPNRRTVRQNITGRDTKVYARQLPSEWPDGGHNVMVGNWAPGSNDSTEPTAAQFNFAYNSTMAYSAPQIISNRGRFYSTTELGRVFDPIMYRPLFDNPAETTELLNRGYIPLARSWPDAVAGQESAYYGGGNTLRIGRPEHRVASPANATGLQAARLLDLFHVGFSRSEDKDKREGGLIETNGHININTASREALRIALAGSLVMDESLAYQTSPAHAGSPLMAPRVRLLKLPEQENPARVFADHVAEAIINNRPYASAANVAEVQDANLKHVFGNKEQFVRSNTIEWTDAAAEEFFGRVYESSTVRSRNFRVWIIGQSISPTMNMNENVEVLADVRQNFTVFANPDERLPDGSIDETNFAIQVISTNEF